MTQIQRVHLTKRYSEAAIYNNVVYLAGQVPENSGEEVYAQTQEVLGLIDKLLSEANSDKSRILSCQIFLAGMKDYVEMNRAWDEWVAAGRALQGTRGVVCHNVLLPLSCISGYSWEPLRITGESATGSGGFKRKCGCPGARGHRSSPPSV